MVAKKTPHCSRNEQTHQVVLSAISYLCECKAGNPVTLCDAIAEEAKRVERMMHIVADVALGPNKINFDLQSLLSSFYNIISEWIGLELTVRAVNDDALVLLRLAAAEKRILCIAEMCFNQVAEDSSLFDNAEEYNDLLHALFTAQQRLNNVILLRK
jgi:hypothetical protein